MSIKQAVNINSYQANDRVVDIDRLSLPSAKGLSLDENYSNRVNLLYKHPVTDFDFVDKNGTSISVSVRGLREGESRSDASHRFCVACRGVSNEGWKFTVGAAEDATFLVRTRAGDNQYSFNRVGTTA